MSIKSLFTIGTILGCACSVYAQYTPVVNLGRVRWAADQLDRIFAPKGLEQTKVPGMAIAVVYKDQVILLNGYGTRKVGRTEQVTADTVFQLASLSKPITSTILGAMVTKGELSWEDRVAAYDPNFSLSDPWVTDQVTVRDFMTHRSGLHDHQGDILEDLGYDRDEVLYRLRNIPLAPFRSEYAYTNFGITQAAEAAAWKYGDDWEEIAKDFIYRPLGMKSTSSRHADFLAATNRASLHALIDGQMVPKYDRNPDAQSPAGGVSSNVRDMARWALMVLNKGTLEGTKAIDPGVLAEILSPQIISGHNPDSGRANFYGIGWSVIYDEKGRINVQHSGAFSMGAGTNVSLFPEEEVGIVTLTNGAPVGLAEAMADTFYDMLHNGMPNGKLSQDWVALWASRMEKALKDPIIDYSKLSPPLHPVAPSLPLSAYTGFYHSDYYGDIQIGQSGDHLVVWMPPNRALYQMGHWYKETFTYVFNAESNMGTRGITFSEPDANGNMGKLVVDNFRFDGGGEFQRVNTDLAPVTPQAPRHWQRKVKRFHPTEAAPESDR